MAKSGTRAAKKWAGCQPIEDWLEAQPKTRNRGRLEEALEQLHRLFERDDRMDLRWWYAVGTHLNTLRPAAPKGSRGGETVIPLLPEYLPWKPEREKETSVVNRLTRARALARKLPKGAMEKIAKVCDSHDNRVTVSQVLYCMAALDGENAQENAKKCWELIEKSREHNWTAAELRQEIYKRRGHKGGTGRSYEPPKVKPRPGVALQDLIREADRWEKFLKYSFQHEDAPLAGSSAVKKRDRRWARERLDEALDRLVEIGKLVNGAKKDLRGLKSRIEAP
jgi:hypothetical protein